MPSDVSAELQRTSTRRSFYLSRFVNIILFESIFSLALSRRCRRRARGENSEFSPRKQTKKQEEEKKNGAKLGSRMSKITHIFGENSIDSIRLCAVAAYKQYPFRTAYRVYSFKRKCLQYNEFHIYILYII